MIARTVRWDKWAKQADRLAARRAELAEKLVRPPLVGYPDELLAVGGEGAGTWGKGSETSEVAMVAKKTTKRRAVKKVPQRRTGVSRKQFLELARLIADLSKQLQVLKSSVAEYAMLERRMRFAGHALLRDDRTADPRVDPRDQLRWQRI